MPNSAVVQFVGLFTTNIGAQGVQKTDPRSRRLGNIKAVGESRLESAKLLVRRDGNVNNMLKGKPIKQPLHQKISIDDFEKKVPKCYSFYRWLGRPSKSAFLYYIVLDRPLASAQFRLTPKLWEEWVVPIVYVEQRLEDDKKS